MIDFFAAGLVLGSSICQTWATIPPGPCIPGHGYTVACGVDVDALLIDIVPVDPNPADPPQIQSADAGGECGDQVIAFPPGLPPGQYILSGTILGCGECEERAIRPRIVEVQ